MIHSEKQVPVHILQSLQKLLCRGSEPHLLRAFATTVTNKWLIYLLSDSDIRVVEAAYRILGRLLVSLG